MRYLELPSPERQPRSGVQSHHRRVRREVDLASSNQGSGRQGGRVVAAEQGPLLDDTAPGLAVAPAAAALGRVGPLGPRAQIELMDALSDDVSHTVLTNHVGETSNAGTVGGP